MKLATYNVNGIRAAIKKGLVDWIKETEFDFYCFQETKAQPDQIPNELFEELGYHCYWKSATKKGYSGVGIVSKHKADEVIYDTGKEIFDFEGRIIQAKFNDLNVISAYFPSGTTGDIRQDVKYQFLDAFYEFIQEKKENEEKIIISGDYNICHKAIDIHNPVSNKNSSGFLPEEREWMDKFFENGFVDSFREYNPNPDQYSWWSFRFNSRANNKGWRIDYNALTENMKSHIKSSEILSDVVHSDHCPVLLELKP